MPQANAICERVIGILRREFPDRTLIHGERHLRQVPTEYLGHRNTVRLHRALCQLSLHHAETTAPEPINLADRRLSCKPTLGSLTSEYQIAT